MRTRSLLVLLLSTVALSSAAWAGKIHEAAARGDNAAIAKLLRANPKLLNTPDERHGCIPTDWTPLHIAVWRGQAATVKYLLSKGANVNARGSFKDTPLHLAARDGRSDIVKMLLQAGAKPNLGDNGDRTPLHEAKNWKVAVLFLAHKADINAANRWGQTPLASALSENRQDVVKCLLNRGAKVTINEAAMLGDVARIQALLKADTNRVNTRTKQRETPLHFALLHKHKEAAKVLLAVGANVRAADQTGITPLHYAAANGYADIAAALLDKGALVNVGINEGNYWPTPLHAAAGTGNREMAELLLSRGAKIDIRCYGFAETPLHTAAEFADDNMVEFLISRGADPNIRKFSKSGDTPLHLAVKHNRVKMVELLLDKGADINAIGEYGQTALHKAVRWLPEDAEGEHWRDYRHTKRARFEKGTCDKMVSLLISRGADINAIDAKGKTVLSQAESKIAVDLLISAGVLSSSIFDAAKAGNTARLEALLASDDRLDMIKDDLDRTPMHCAAIGGSEEAVRVLLARDAWIEGKDKLGMTPIHLAAREGNTAVVKVLLDKGARADEKDKCDLTPLQYASEGGHKEIAALLQERARKTKSKQ